MNKLFRGAAAFAMLLFVSFATAQYANDGFGDDAIWFSGELCEYPEEEPSGGVYVDRISDPPEMAESYLGNHSRCVDVITYHGDVEDYMEVMSDNLAETVHHNDYDDEIPYFAMSFGMQAVLYVVRPAPVGQRTPGSAGVPQVGSGLRPV